MDNLVTRVRPEEGEDVAPRLKAVQELSSQQPNKACWHGNQLHHGVTRTQVSDGTCDFEESWRTSPTSTNIIDGSRHRMIACS